MKLLHIDTSIQGAHSASRRLSQAIVDRLQSAGSYDLTYRDLVAENPPHLTLATLPWDHPTSAKAGPLDTAAKAVRDDSQRMLDEFLTADVVVIGVAMYNFTVPTQLKAWIDRIIVPEKTFRLRANGSEGLAGAKRVIVAVTRGWAYEAGTDNAANEHAETFIRTALGFMGVTRPEVIVAEGLAAGDEAREAATKSALASIRRLAA